MELAPGSFTAEQRTEALDRLANNDRKVKRHLARERYLRTGKVAMTALPAAAAGVFGETHYARELGVDNLRGIDVIALSWGSISMYKLGDLAQKIQKRKALKIAKNSTSLFEQLGVQPSYHMRKAVEP